MPKRGELSSHHEIKPTELALELAERETRLKEKNSFETDLVNKISNEYLNVLKAGKEFWGKKIEDNLERLQKPKPKTLSLGDYLLWEEYTRRLSGSSYDIKDSEIILKSAQRIKPYFKYTKNGRVDKILFDLVIAGGIEDQDSAQEEPGSKDFKEPLLSGLSNFEKSYFATKPLPENKPEAIFDSDLEHNPLIESVSLNDDVDFEKIWNEAEKTHPAGAKYFLDEITTQEQGNLEQDINYFEYRIQMFEAERQKALKDNKPESFFLQQRKANEQGKKEAQNKLTGLLKFRKNKL